MTEPSKAVFLSYASQDAEAARHICDALRSAGVEVWFDQSELRGGDVWDRQIRKHIHDCALFVPIISSTTQARLEGYFRREWKLAVDRTHDMAEGKPFLVPVVIDDTKDQEAEVPESFRAVQWTRLPEGQTPPAFVERVARLLSPGQAPASAKVRPQAPPTSALVTPSKEPARTSWRSRSEVLLIAAVAVIAVGYVAIDRFVLSKHVAEAVPASASAVQSVAPTQSTIPEKSIAVLPFVDMSEKKDQEYFSDGLSEELIDHLRRLAIDRLPAERAVVRFDFSGLPPGYRRGRVFWLITERAEVELCLKDPGAEVDLYVSADLGSFARVWLGDTPFSEALRAGSIRLTGRRDLVRRFPSWLMLSHFAEVPPRSPKHSKGPPNPGGSPCR